MAMLIVSIRPVLSVSTTTAISSFPTARRARTLPTTLCESALPVLLATTSATSAISTVPTVYRSPSSGWDEFAHYTSSSGKVLGVRNGDNLSYGYILIHIRVYFLASITIL